VDCPDKRAYGRSADAGPRSPRRARQRAELGTFRSARGPLTADRPAGTLSGPLTHDKRVWIKRCGVKGDPVLNSGTATPDDGASYE
jgi:hypothetical protein